jgi:ABC-2 type transport system permease protein
MNSLIRKGRILFLTYYAHMLEYRAEIFLWALSGCLPIILMGVWIQAAQKGNFGLTAVDFARYFFTVFVIRQFTTVWVVWEFEKEVVQGSLSFRLLQPLDPVWHHIMMHLAEKATRIPLVIGLTCLFFWLYPQAFWVPSWQNACLFFLAIVMAFCLRFILQYTFALCAFWTERASAIEQFWFLFYLFLSGMIAPLEVFPPALQQILQWTPFPYFINFPAAILIGLPVNFGRSILVIIFWIFFLFILNRFLWRQGLKKYSGMGA